MSHPDSQRGLRATVKQWIKRRVRRYEAYRHRDPIDAVKCAEHPAACSCMACGNPRKWWAMPTMQERRLQAYTVLDDYYLPDTRSPKLTSVKLAEGAEGVPAKVKKPKKPTK